MPNKNIFDRANEFIRNSESSLVNLLSAVAPWGAPLAPAYMSFGGMTKYLGFTPFVAGVIAGVIEILGLATVHTTLSFWQHNRRYARQYKKMPTLLAGGMFAFYLIIILTVNVLMEALVSWPGMPILARALLSLLAVPAAVTMAIRTQHTELLHEIKGGKKAEGSETSRGKKAERKVSANSPATSDWRTLPTEDKEIIRTMSAVEIAQKYQVSERTGRSWIAKSQGNNGQAHDV